MTRPWSAYLRNATDKIPPMPVNLRSQLLRLLVPELADLRQQLDQARRLAGEAQRKYRESGLLLLDEIRQKLAMMDERDQLRVDRDRQLAALAEMRESLRAFADSAAKERDALMGEVAKHRARAAELEAERAKANEPRPMITTIKGQAPRLEFAADGQPITYVTPQPEPASDNQGALRYDDFKPTRYL